MIAERMMGWRYWLGQGIDSRLEGEYNQSQFVIVTLVL